MHMGHQTSSQGRGWHMMIQYLAEPQRSTSRKQLITIHHYNSTTHLTIYVCSYVQMSMCARTCKKERGETEAETETGMKHLRQEHGDRGQDRIKLGQLSLNIQSQPLDGKVLGPLPACGPAF